MQNINNMSFFYVHNPVQVQYYAYIPISPSFSETSPSSEHPFSSTAAFVFPSSVDSCSYGNDLVACGQEGQNFGGERMQTKHMGQHSEVVMKEVADTKMGLATMSSVRSLKEQQERILKREEQSLGFVLRNSQQKLNKERKKNRKIELDHDYLPEKYKNMKNHLKYQVNQNRNVIPNEINQIFSFVQKQNKSGKLVSRLFEKYVHPEEYTIKRFYLYQALLKNRLGHYTNERSLKLVNELYEPKCENWTENEQRYYNKLCRILIHHFLHEDSIFIILTSKRMKKEKKSDHLRARRQIALSADSILKGF